jgi:hypothetical protein
MNAASEGVVVVIVGNKSDVEDKRLVAAEVGADLPCLSLSLSLTLPLHPPPPPPPHTHRCIFCMLVSVCVCVLNGARWRQDGEHYAASIGALFVEASARTGANVQHVFELAGTWWVPAAPCGHMGPGDGVLGDIMMRRASPPHTPLVRRLPPPVTPAPAAATASKSVSLTAEPAHGKKGCC